MELLIVIGVVLVIGFFIKKSQGGASQPHPTEADSEIQVFKDLDANGKIRDVGDLNL
ncbi:hypothetical protein KW843_24980 [Acidovorax sp. sif1233]|jgi:hypothetical protein|uniref:hypothetical protein n=1 Tax=unclassified Acidovorax TaxID=2684926 RepID=UPI000F15862E|nr:MULTISPECIES: hypothetical protein [unclassified Acidovorax]MBV7457750.1 hypothetical protein [Acidovorax sp. sif1233]RMA56408.1 hypothetical protein C8C96_4825 [Acidovorax sp. 100]